MPSGATSGALTPVSRLIERPHALIALFVLLACLPFIVNPFYLGVVVLGAIYAVAVLGLYFVMGLTGQLSLAQGAFFGVGAYTAAILSSRYGWSFIATMGATVVVGALVGLALGYTTLRLTGHYLALATIGFAVIANVVFLHWKPVTNGADGISGIKPPRIGGFILDQNFYYYDVVLAVLIVLALVGWRLKQSRVGLAFLAIREDQLAASAAGINILNFKVLAFTLSTVYGAVAGGLYAHGLTHYISPDNFAFELSVTMLVMLLLGGQATVPGAIVGAMLVTALPEALRFLDQYYLAVYGVAVVLLVIFLPQGLWGWLESVIRRRSRATPTRPGPVSQSERAVAVPPGARPPDVSASSGASAADTGSERP
jgi:ABC-type branched-subunit amino acid transport system permease subunit